MSRLYLDDLRETPAGSDWTRAYTAGEAIYYLSRPGAKFDLVSLDHDLGSCRNCLKEGAALLSGCTHVGNGNQVLLWIEEKAFRDSNFVPPETKVHTANPAAQQKMSVGADKINACRKERLTRFI